MSGFHRRNQWHDRAVEKIVPILTDRGFAVIEHGIEVCKEAKDIISEDDRCSLMMRFRPDIFTVVPAHRSFLCEVKSKPEKRDNRYPRSFTWEARSYLALKEWNRGGNVAMLALHDFNSGVSYGTWLEDLSAPACVFVPRDRWDVEEQKIAMRRFFPNTSLRSISVNGGAGTPFITPSLDEMMELERFIDTELLGVMDGAPPRGQHRLLEP